jgi:hypothetical protein
MITGFRKEEDRMAESETNQMPTTTKGMLDAVNSAIMAIAVGGQSYKIGSRSLTRADLKQLYNIKNDLTAQLAAESSGGLLDDCYVAEFDGR